MTTTPPPEFDSQLSTKDILKLHDFRWLWLGQIISNFGDSLTALALILLINRVTDGSTTAIATLLIAMALPAATLGLVAGVLVDRFNRRRVMIVSDLLRGGLVLLFILVGSGSDARLWLLYLIAFMHSTIATFFGPARMAIMPKIVPKTGLLAANSLSQISAILFRILGTAVAGVLVGLLDTFWPVFLIDSATFFLSAFCIYQIHIAKKDAKANEEKETAVAIFSELRQGLNVIIQNRILIGIIVGTGVTMLGLGAINVLLAPLVVNDLNASETWFGILEFAQSAAMILSGLFVAALAARIKPTHLISGGLIILGLAVAALAPVTQVWHLIPVMIVMGLVITPAQSSMMTLLQSTVADEVMGRVGAVLGTVVQIASLLSMFVAGTLAALIGTSQVFILGGALTVAAGILAAFIFRGYKSELETGSESEQAVEIRD